MVEDDPSSLVCVLIDEVESLASCRNNTAASGDPSDAMRAVNSLLTSLDRLRSFPNVLVLATTNLTGSIDDAFLDRVDLKMHIGLPILRARYQILQTCLEELLRVGIIAYHPTMSKGPSSIVMDFDELDSEGEHKEDAMVLAASSETTSEVENNTNERLGLGMLLRRCAQQAEGLSGRSLRKLPLQAHAQFLNGGMEGDGISLQLFLEALCLAIEDEKKARAEL
jgi:SpoVK/Ycf46/Vps4 family AAA+-type ATPase